MAKLKIPYMILLAIFAISCQKTDNTTIQQKSDNKKTNQETKQKDAMKIEVKSSAFEENGSIPKKYTCDGENMSPPLQWSDVKGSRSYAMICEDPDAPSKTWIHWIVYNIPSDTRELNESAPAEGKLKNGAMQGTNDFKKAAYGGPCPPSGTHRYLFKVYALDVMLDVSGTVTKDKLLDAMNTHILAEGQLTGKYGKQ